MVTGCYDDDFEVTEEERAMVGQEGGENEETLLAAEGLDDSLKDSQVKLVCHESSNCSSCYCSLETVSCRRM